MSMLTCVFKAGIKYLLNSNTYFQFNALFGNKNGIEFVYSRYGYEFKLPILFNNIPSFRRGLPIIILSSYYINKIIRNKINDISAGKVKKIRKKNHESLVEKYNKLKDIDYVIVEKNKYNFDYEVSK